MVHRPGRKHALGGDGLFPPAAAGAAGATLAVKASSMLGAGLGSGTAQKIYQYPSTTAGAKDFLRDTIDAKQDELTKLYVSNADAWIRDRLMNHGIAQLTTKLHRQLTDADVRNVSVVSKNELRNYTLNEFIFPTISPFSVATLQRTMNQVLQKALLVFNEQLRQYTYTRNMHLVNYLSPAGGGSNYMYDQEKASYPPFHANITFAGIPGAPAPRRDEGIFGPNGIGGLIQKWVSAYGTKSPATSGSKK